MMDDPNRIAQESYRILEHLAATSFDNCYPLSRRFSELPKRAGIYAITHRDQGFLYIGKQPIFRCAFVEDTKRWPGPSLIA